MKNIISIEYDFPGIEEDSYASFSSGKSLADADIVVFLPNVIHRFSWSPSDKKEDKPSFNENESHRIRESIEHWNREIKYYLNSGKTLFIILNDMQEYFIESRRENIYGKSKSPQIISYVEKRNNYDFLPISNFKIIAARGSKIKFNQDTVFDEYFNSLKDYLEYRVFLDIQDVKQIFSTPSGDRILGCYSKYQNSHIVFLPFIDFDREDFIQIKKRKLEGEVYEEEHWSSKAIKIGQKFIQELINIDASLTNLSAKTPTPEWVKNPIYFTTRETKLQSEIDEKRKIISELNSSLDKLNYELDDERKIKDLLFESGKRLENAVIEALKIIGYSAENYNDGELELDQIIISPEGNRFIGECEGKDRKPIDISKIRQLSDAINEDFEKQKIEVEAKGILFGNPYRLLPLPERQDNFTSKCKAAAKRLNIALVKTSDLFFIVKYLKENKDTDYAKLCRNAIVNQLGAIVEFPTIPNNNS